MKLKDLLNENLWNERKFGEPLPTLEDTTKAHKLKQEQDGKEQHLDDKEKEKARKLGLVWKGKGYGKKDDDHISHKNVDGKLTKVDDDGKSDKSEPKKLSGKDFNRDLPSDGPNPTSTDSPLVKKGEPVKIDDDAQDTIDGMDWDKYSENIPVSYFTSKFSNNTDEWNAQVNRVYDEMTGQIPREDLEKLEDALIRDEDEYDYDLSEVPEEEMKEKSKILKDFHTKYSTSGNKKSASIDKVRTAKELNDSEQIKKDPMGTVEKLDDLLQDVSNELEDNEQADEEYAIVNDEFGIQLTRLMDDIEYGDDEEKEDAIKGLEDLTSDVEKFMNVNYSKVVGITKPERGQKIRGPRSMVGYRTGRNRSGGMYDNVNPSNKYLVESVNIFNREFGQPLPTLNDVIKAHQSNLQESREDAEKAKKELRMFAKEEGILRKRVLKLEGLMKNDSENKDLAKQIKKSYKDNVTKFMREAVGLVKRMK